MKALSLGLKALFIIACMVLIAGVIGGNTEPIAVSLFDRSTLTYPKWQVLLTCTLVGALLATLFFIVEFVILETRIIRLRRVNHRLERALAVAQGKPEGSSPSLGQLEEEQV
jgi:hypothetical protein